MRDIEDADHVLALAVALGGKVYHWAGKLRAYRCEEDGTLLDLRDPKIARAVQKAQLDMAARLLAAALDDEVTLAHLPKPEELAVCHLVGTMERSDLDHVAMAAVRLAAKNGDWRPISRVALVAEIHQSTRHVRRGTIGFEEIAAWMQLADREGFLLGHQENVHFTESFIRVVENSVNVRMAA